MTEGTTVLTTFSIPVTPTRATSYQIQCLADVNGIAQADRLTGRTTVTVNPVPPTPTIAGLSTANCQKSTPVSLTGNPAGGTFTIDGIQVADLIPSRLSAGQHTVAYSLTNTQGCSASTASGQTD